MNEYDGRRSILPRALIRILRRFMEVVGQSYAIAQLGCRVCPPEVVCILSEGLVELRKCPSNDHCRITPTMVSLFTTRTKNPEIRDEMSFNESCVND